MTKKTKSKKAKKQEITKSDPAILWVVERVRAIQEDLPDDMLYFYEQEIEVLYERFGTPDIYGVSYGLSQAIIFDFKYGQSPVDKVQYNLQLKDYALGIQEMYGVKTVRAVILQPEHGVLDDHVYSEDELQKAKEYIKEILYKAEQPGAELRPSDKACMFCKANKTGLCPALRGPALNIPQDQSVLEYLQSLKPEQRTAIYEALLAGKKWFTKAVKEVQEDVIKDGLDIVGYEVGDGKAKAREWIDESQAIIELQKYVEETLEEKFVLREFVKLISAAEVENRLGHKKAVLEMTERLTDQDDPNKAVVKS